MLLFFFANQIGVAADRATYTRGLDVSHYQGAIDWPSVASTGLRFVFIKATDGALGRDPKFLENWDGAGRVGLIRGAYAFYRAGEDPIRQAQNILTFVRLDKGDLPIVLDVETLNRQKLDPTRMAADLWILSGKLEQHYGRKPIIYTTANFWDRNVQADFSVHPLWIAEYLVTAPHIPKKWRQWRFWQYSQSGRVNGIAGAVDLDYFSGSIKSLKKLTLP